MDETTTAPTTSGRAASGGGWVKKMAAQKIEPRNTSKPKKKKPKQVRLPFGGGNDERGLEHLDGEHA